MNKFAAKELVASLYKRGSTEIIYPLVLSDSSVLAGRTLLIEIFLPKDNIHMHYPPFWSEKSLYKLDSITMNKKQKDLP